jgi:hypothetical protein
MFELLPGHRRESHALTDLLEDSGGRCARGMLWLGIASEIVVIGRR